MDTNRFDQLTRALSITLTRRGLAGALVATALGLPAMADARKKRKKKPKIKRNDFGCVNVGNACKNDSQCCSSICEGKQGKKRCKAHDTGGCRAGQTSGACGGIDSYCTMSSGALGSCNTTTGIAGVCSSSVRCAACATDAECAAQFGANSACVACAICADTGGFGCAMVPPD
jgi:hypothetical protein